MPRNVKGRDHAATVVAERARRVLNPHVTLRAITVPDKRKEAARRACRGRIAD